MAKTRRMFSAEFKREAVQMATKPGNSIAQVAKDLELGESNLRSWVRQFGSSKWEAAPGKELKAASTQELERVKRELNRVKMERDILKKALAGSTGRCNSFIKSSSRRRIAQGLSWTSIHTLRDRVEPLLRHLR